MLRNFRLLHSLKLAATAPENGWLNTTVSFWGGLFSGAKMLSVSVMVQSFTAENPSSMISSRRSDQLDKSQLDQLTPGPERFT